LQICESVNLRDKKWETCRFADSQLTDLQIWDTLVREFAIMNNIVLCCLHYYSFQINLFLPPRVGDLPPQVGDLSLVFLLYQ
jgi:hypothetical protein